MLGTLARTDEAAKTYHAVIGCDCNLKPGGALVMAQRGANVSGERQVAEDALGFRGFLERRVIQQIHDLIGAFLDGQPLGVEHEVVLVGMLPADPEMAPRYRAMRFFRQTDFVLDEVTVIGME